MPTNDVFAFDTGGFNGFLFATIGTEVGGSGLTVLSALARLGEDPWAKAASWARLSKAAAGEALAACIAQMPLTQEDLRAAPLTAARLVMLLSPAVTARPAGASASIKPVEPRLRMALAIMVCAMVLIGGAILVFSAAPSTHATLGGTTVSHAP